MRFSICAGNKTAVVEISQKLSELIDPDSEAKLLGLYGIQGYMKQIVLIVEDQAEAWRIGESGKYCLVWTRENSRGKFTKAVPDEANPDFAYLDKKTREYSPEEQAERLKRSNGQMTTRNGWVIAEELGDDKKMANEMVSL